MPSVGAGRCRWPPLLRRDPRAPAAKHELLHLAGGRLRQLGDEMEGLRALEVGETGAHERSQLDVGGGGAGAQHDEGVGCLAPLHVRHPHYRPSCTAVCSSRVPSTSTDEMFSPPLMITSLMRSRTSMNPSACTTAASPEW